jgi:hypothetical protein
MPTLADDLSYLIDRDHQTARPLLHDLVARLPNSSRRAACSGSRISVASTRRMRWSITARVISWSQKTSYFANGWDFAQRRWETTRPRWRIYRDAISLAPTEVSGSMTALLLHRLGRIAMT